MTLTFKYTNWRGETALRSAVPSHIYYGMTDWHPEPGTLLAAFDVEKQAYRDFALKDCDFTYAPDKNDHWRAVQLYGLFDENPTLARWVEARVREGASIKRALFAAMYDMR